MDKNDIIEYVMNTPHNTNKAVLSSMLNQLTEGGGSSDFSMATVTIEGDDDLRMSIPFIMMEANGMPYDACTCIASLEGGETYSIPLYKGKALVSFNSGDASTLEVSGNIQYVSDIRAYLITGDCTITIS